MKKKLFAVLACALAALAAPAQDSLRVARMEPRMSDVYDVLEVLDVHLFRFDLRPLLSRVYNVDVYVDEYGQGEEQAPRRVRTVPLGKNVCSLDLVPEDQHDAWRRLKGIPEGKDTWDNLRELSLYLTMDNDSTAKLTVNVPGVIRSNSQLKLHPVGQDGVYFYVPRPFTLPAAAGADSLRIPLLLYGSGWEDTRYHVIRFCGENEIDPALKAGIVAEIPHYYVVGLELKREAGKGGE